jgi:hypothetical protein
MAFYVGLLRLSFFAELDPKKTILFEIFGIYHHLPQKKDLLQLRNLITALPKDLAGKFLHVNEQTHKIFSLTKAC